MLLVKSEEDEGEKYEMMKLKIPMDHREVSREAPAPVANGAGAHLGWPAAMLLLALHVDQVSTDMGERLFLYT